MDNTTLVYQCAEPADRLPACLPGGRCCSIQSSSTRSSRTEPQALSHGMQTVRSHFLNNSVPPDITEIIMSSWKSSTQKQYNVYIHKWIECCAQRQVNSLSPAVTDILRFLHTLYQQDVSYSTLNTACSALSTLLMNHSIGSHNPITTHPFVIRYMKGILNSRKPTPKYSETWDVNLVLDHLKTLHLLTELSLTVHSHKLAMALTSGQRCQTLVASDIANMKQMEQCYVFNLEEHAKQNRPGNVFSSFCVRKYNQDNLCPYRALESYLDKTSVLCGTTTSKLFVSYIKPHKAIGTHTFGRWIEQLLQDSGIDTTTFKAHSTRAASVSKVSNSLTTDTILKHVGWKCDCVFRKFYHKPIVTSHLFQEAVLQ